MNKKLILLFIVLIGFSIVLWQYFFYDNVVTSGAKYGFVIGMTKNEALEVIGQDYADNNIQVVLSPKIERSPSNEITYLEVMQLDHNKVKKMDLWQLRFRRSDTNVLVLHFSKNKLVEMTRYRRAFIP